MSEWQDKKTIELVDNEEIKELLLADDYEEPFNKEIIYALIKREVTYDDVVNELLKKRPIFYDKNGIWWMWKKNKWEMVDEVEILIAIKDAFEWSGVNNSTIRNQFLKALQTESRRIQPKEPPKELIQFDDIIIDYKTGKIFRPNPKYLFTNPIPWKLGKSEETPNIDKLVSSWVGEKYTQLAYEVMAYCLLRDYPIQRIIALVGSGSNGKGQFVGLIRRLLGKENVTSSDLDRLNKERFEASKLYKKLMCEIAETNFNVLKQTSTIKRLCGGDLLSCEFKGKNPFDFINYAKLIISSNSLPMTMDRTDGYYRRWLIIKFPNKFNDGKSVIDNIPDEEFENLARKLVNTLKELTNRGKFIFEGSIDERRQIYEEVSNPIKTFIKSFYETDYNKYTLKREFNDALWNFLNDNGYRFLSSQEINKALRNMGYEIKVKKINGNTYKVIDGLGKKTDENHQKVTEVTKVTTLSTQKNRKYINLNKKSVTSVTLVTPKNNINNISSLIKEKILFYLKSNAVDSNKEETLIKIIPKKINKVTQEQVKEVINKMKKEGIIYEPKAGVLKIINY